MLDASGIDRGSADVVLIVDDVPDNLSVLHDALDESGYAVLIATDGETALQRAAQAMPDIILLDAMMPGIDGFEVARRLKANEETAHIPIVFMTGLTETEHVVSAFQAGGVDYVTKPIRVQEVLARMTVHMQGARQARHARNALDAFGHASLVVRRAMRASCGRRRSRAACSRRISSAATNCRRQVVPGCARRASAGCKASRRIRSHCSLPTPTQRPRRLIFTLHEADDDEWLLVMRETSDQAVIDAVGSAFGLTAREAEVLYWLAKGKTNRDIGDILGTSPATVKKQLEHVYQKLGVETRTAAASLAMKRVARWGRACRPQCPRCARSTPSVVLGICALRQ